MDRDPPPRTTSSIPFAAGGTTPAGSPMVRGPPMLTALSSSSSSAHSRRSRYSPSLYPPPLPAGRLASGSTAGYSYGSVASLSSRFQFHRQQIPPPLPPRAEVERPAARPHTTRALPTPFLSELAEIRRVGATLFGDLDAPAALHGGRYQQAWPSSSSSATMSARGRSFSGFAQPPPSAAGMSPPPLPSRRFSAGFYSPSASQPSSSRVQPASQQQQAQPLPGGSGILFGLPSPLASQQEQAHPCWSTDLSALSSMSGGSTSAIFTTGSAPSASSQQPAKASSFTDLAPLPGGCGFSGLTPSSNTNEATTMFGTSSWSPADTATAASASDTMYYGHAQPSSSDSSELPPLPPSLQMQPDYQNQELPFWQQPSGNNSCGTETATTAEEPRLQIPTTHLLQVVKEEPVVDEAPPCLEPVFIALDDDGDEDGLLLCALLDSFQQPSGEPASSLPNHAPEGWLQPGGCSGSGAGELLGHVEGSGQSWDLEAMLQTPGSSGASGSIPMNYQGSVSMSQQQQIPPLQGEDDLFSTGLSDIALQWHMSQNNTSGFVQPQPNQQTQLLPFSTDKLHQLNISSPSPSIWGPAAADGSGQGWGNSGADLVSGQVWAGLPPLANMFHHMSIIGQGGLTAPAAAGGRYDDMLGGFDNYSGNSSSAWAGMPSSASNNFDQMGTGGGGSMSIGQGFPATQAPMLDINGSSSNSSWAGMPLNFSSSTMESSIPSVPKLRLGGMERPRVARWTPSSSLSAGATSSGMSQRGAYGDFFSEADMATINKDKRLKEMVNTDPKRVKRILNNRASVAKLRTQRHAC